MVFETLVCSLLNHLTQLIAWQNFIMSRVWLLNIFSVLSVASVSVVQPSRLDQADYLLPDEVTWCCITSITSRMMENMYPIRKTRLATKYGENLRTSITMKSISIYTYLPFHFMFFTPSIHNEWIIDRNTDNFLHTILFQFICLAYISWEVSL
jgi:hypothetical protein